MPHDVQQSLHLSAAVTSCMQTLARSTCGRRVRGSERGVWRNHWRCPWWCVWSCPDHVFRSPRNRPTPSCTFYRWTHPASQSLTGTCLKAEEHAHAQCSEWQFISTFTIPCIDMTTEYLYVLRDPWASWWTSPAVPLASCCRSSSTLPTLPETHNNRRQVTKRLIEHTFTWHLTSHQHVVTYYNKLAITHTRVTACWAPLTHAPAVWYCQPGAGACGTLSM